MRSAVLSPVELIRKAIWKQPQVTLNGIYVPSEDAAAAFFADLKCKIRLL